MNKRVFEFSIPKDHIKVDVAFIGCIEPRFWNPAPGNGLSTIDAFMQDKGWEYTPLTEAGGIKVLVSDDPHDAAQKESLLFRIAQELRLHHPPIIAASVHRDCGGYGYSVAFGNDAGREGERLNADLRKAHNLLKARFGSRVEQILLFIFDFEGVEEVEPDIA